MSHRIKHYHLKFGFVTLFAGLVVLYKGTVPRGIGILLVTVGLFITVSNVFIIRSIISSYEDVNRCLFRRPRAPLLSYILSFHVVHSFVLDALFIALGTYVILYTFPGLKTYQLVLVAIVLAPVSRYVLANGVIRYLKWLLEGQFNVIIFRRFSPQYAHANRVLVAPIFGAYGRVIYIRDQSLLSADPGVNADSELILGEPHLSIQCGDSDWQNTVREELANADLAVFHWLDVPTENMWWEFQQALRFLPVERLFWVCLEPTAGQVEAWLQRAGLSAANVFRVEEHVDYVGGSYKYLSKIVYEKLKSLEVTERRPAKY
ncbi:MAG: hypothetical protein M3362_01495 [Acidobacteriota bacterium]|nr:hypothetical protein [Acidobacteriota bacterium]